MDLLYPEGHDKEGRIYIYIYMYIHTYIYIYIIIFFWGGGLRVWG